MDPELDPTPDPTREARLERLFHRVLELERAQRLAFLRRECAGDTALLDELVELVGADEAPTPGALLSPLRAYRAVPTQIGPYEILDELGEGGMGRVFRARQTEPVRRDVAIKILKGTLDDRGGTARFAAERQALAWLKHPGVAAIYDGGTTDDGRPYLVMELVEGIPLGRWLAERKPPLAARLGLFCALCEAVEHAHQKGVIHRDLKPSNVLVEEAASGARPKVIDFGVARLAPEIVDETLHTVAGAVLGTPGYMSPEQLEGQQSADARSDVYALGVILYAMLAGRSPFADAATRSPAALVDAVRGGSPARPSSIDGALVGPGDLDWIVLRALAYEPERRYPTVEALRRDVLRFLRDEPVGARPPSAFYVLSKFVRRHRGSVLSAAVAVLALVAGLGIALQQWQRARTSDAESRRHLADFRRLVDDKRLADLVREADELWPAWPAVVPRMDRWIERAEALAAKRAALGVRAAEIEREAAAARGEAARFELAYQAEVLDRLVEGLDELAAPAPTRTNIAGVRARREEALRTGERSLDRAAAAWREVRAAIADPVRSPLYNGLELAPQVGLVPLRAQPDTGLWEFWHVASGDRPESDGAGGWRIAEGTGMVFVLVPAGRYVIGAVPDPKGAGEAPVDPRAAPMEQFVRHVDLDAFFVSRYELTQGQWLRFTGENPSYVQATDVLRGHTPDLTHPVEQVSWDQADAELARMGLQLPTEGQWEYVCRAGTRTAFASGDDPVEVCGRDANFADEASRAFLKVHTSFDPGTDDGFALTAPVGSFAANPWGLHDVHGNVGEWCRDWLVSYTEAWRPGDGLRAWANEATSRAWRGGNFADPSLLARSAARNGYPPDLRTARLGIRAVRPVLPAAAPGADGPRRGGSVGHGAVSSRR